MPLLDTVAAGAPLSATDADNRLSPQIRTSVPAAPFCGWKCRVRGAGADGNFYGTTGVIGDSQHGSAYKLTPTGQFTLLHTLGKCLSGVVDQLLEGSDGKLYGVTEDNTFFSLTTVSKAENLR